MVESADEPPLRGLHPWAKNFLSPRDPSEKDIPSSSSSRNQNILPQHAGDTDAVRGRGTRSEIHASDLPNTQPQDAPVVDKKENGETPATMTENGATTIKAPIYRRFVRDAKLIITASWINWLLVFVPVSITLGGVSEWGGVDAISPNIVFALNAVSIIPLASLLAYATESVALKLGDSWGALLNVTFGNATEIIVFVIGLTSNEVRIVQAAAVGSILSNLLLILGMAFVLGGLRFREQLYNQSVSQLSSCLLSLSVISLLVPTAFHAAFADDAQANILVLKVSRGTSVVLLLVYVLYILFQLKSHAFMYESTPQHVIDEESRPGVLAQVFDTSSDSSSSSSSSDSDSSAGSHKTANRIKRALRRKRRKSSSSTKDETPSIRVSRSETNTDTLVDDAVFSGDEADGEDQRRGRAVDQTVQTRDFETGSGKEKFKQRGKRSKRSKKSKVAAQNSEKADLKAQTAERAVPSIRVGFSENVQEIPAETNSRRPQNNTRNFSNVIKPVLNSSNFPHHEATIRSLAPPFALRTQDRVVNRGSGRRASSMPDIHRQVSSFARPSSPRPLSIPVNAVGEAQIMETINPEVTHLSTTSAMVMLLITTALVALCAEFLVGSIDHLISSTGISQAFVGLIVLPIIGNAAEHITAVTVAYKNKMDLSINIALGSSIQIALFVTPLMVMLGWAIGAEFSLYFSLFETMSLFGSTFIVNYLMIDGRSNWLEGVLLIAAYVIIAISAFFIPTCGLSDTNGLIDSPRSC